MSSFNFHKLDSINNVARITLVRPKHNVLNIAMMNEFNNLMEDLVADNDLKCVAIYGDGPSWCAGVDVGEHKPEIVDEMIATFTRMFELIHQLEVPIVAVVHGACLGGGMELAIACDMIVASDSAKFGQPEIKLGFFPPYAAVRLPSLCGPGKAIEVCTTGKTYSAQEAHSMGFVTHVTADDQLNATADKLIGEIQTSSPLIIRLNKRAVKEQIGKSMSAAMDAANDLFLNQLMKTHDTQEGIASFYERRKPEWRNK